MVGQLMALLAVASRAAPEPGFDVVLPAEWTTQAAALLPEGPIYVGIAPGAGGAAKRWELDRFIALARLQRERGRVPVFVLGPAEAELLAELRQALPEARFPLQDAALSTASEPSPLLTMALAQRLAAAVANDSGTGHLLAAAGCAMVSLFGPTRPQKFAPAARRLTIVDARDFGEAVMASITVATVDAALERMLAQG
jgi:ADP-heptose:LPS heptosyltransferase